MKPQVQILEGALERAITIQFGQLFEVLVSGWLDSDKAIERFENGVMRLLAAADAAANVIRDDRPV